MRQALVVLTMALAAISLSIVKAGAADHYQKITIYAAAAAAAFKAERTCPGTKANRSLLLLLRGEAAISDPEEKIVDDELLRIEKGLSEQIASNGPAAWCSAMLQSFGPSGALIKGLISR